MNDKCYVQQGDDVCVMICGKLVCDKDTVDDYGKLCERCVSGDKKACIEMTERYGCWSTSGWWW
ncbi:hypothetical protein [Acidianus manzaensis]|uniref:Uncharacterized protein n=1 Tax=Acidianus manzaensis TaxID=282676 RepID=A0A1W6K166_9CREN|nr:hypothetical protein [Acidianus manzaensis]ARM76249.1 hypothetical protein B6F84_09575 [Acidianus manzaensis]